MKRKRLALFVHSSFKIALSGLFEFPRSCVTTQRLCTRACHSPLIFLGISLCMQSTAGWCWNSKFWVQSSHPATNVLFFLSPFFVSSRLRKWCGGGVHFFDVSRVTDEKCDFSLYFGYDASCLLRFWPYEHTAFPEESLQKQHNTSKCEDRQVGSFTALSSQTIFEGLLFGFYRLLASCVAAFCAHVSVKDSSTLSKLGKKRKERK